MSFLFWLYRSTTTELKIVLVTLGVLLLLPAFTVVVLASSGVSIVGQALAAVNPITHLVEVFDADGNKVHELELSTVWPASGYVSDEFGTHQTFRKLLGLNAHTGIDIADPRGRVGSPVTPFMTGKVMAVDDVDDSACGKSVKIEHGHGITSLYCHLHATSAVVGVEVKPGDVIGYMGSTGTSTGPHLHFQTMVYGIPVNPRTFMVGEPLGAR
jgi:murein DD-endopeptidase MepM/ murein hydrolase activator NlpD